MKESSRAINPSRRQLLRRGLVATGVIAAGPALWGAGSHAASPRSALPAGATGRTSNIPHLADTLHEVTVENDLHTRVRLPRGFTIREVARTGQRPLATSDYIWHQDPDGGATFATGDGGWVYVSNAEASERGHGGVGALRFDDAGRLIDAYPICSGTTNNCAGGPTPWGTWITCEETTVTQGEVAAKDHGFNFEVPATTEMGLADPIPLTEMGRFNHEAVAVHPDSGIVYETEDQGDGLIYRFIPNEPERLQAGGRLQALAVRGRQSLDTRNWQEPLVRPGDVLDAVWIDLDDVTAPDDDLRYRGFEAGAARFARGEGMWWGNDSVYFACTNGGSAQAGQVWRYTPHPEEGRPDAAGRLELFIEPNDTELVENCDNVTVTPWGDLILCEDGPGEHFLVGVTPAGELYRFGRNAASASEFAGATFSPDGSTLFINMQADGLTFAITGRWRR